MTNAEKMAKDTEFLAKVIAVGTLPCHHCMFHGDDCTEHCCEVGIKKWLESEAEE